MTIPGENTDVRKRTLPGNTDPTFHSYTDGVQPEDQSDRPLFKAVNEGRTVEEEAINRQLRGIKARGEQVYYIKRIFDTNYCSCYNPDTRMSRRARCPLCYGTGIVDGYRRYNSAANQTGDGKIYIAAPMAPKELGLESYGFDVLQNYNYWTTPKPAINVSDNRDPRTYDWIIRYRKDNTEIGRYYVTAAAISYWKDNVPMHQAFNVKLADPDETIYRIDVQELKVEDGP